MPKINLPNVTLNYELAGPENAPVLVFAHSLGLNLKMWDPQVDSLSLKYRILRYDMRGHGSSSTPPGPYTIEQLGNDAINLLDALHLDEVAFCGLSLGGATAQWLALHAPSRLNKLILSNTAAKIGTQEIWAARIADITEHGLQFIADGSVHRWFTPGFVASNPAVTTRFQQMLLSNDPAGYIANCAVVRDVDLRDSINQIRTPVCIIAGDQDPVTPPEAAHFMQSKIPNSQLVTLPAAHVSNVEAAGLFNAAVSNFLG
jgi:3-oxoadipate enol-lactonase